MAAFINEARLRRIDRLAVTSFANGATDFAPQIDVLRSSGAAVVRLGLRSDLGGRDGDSVRPIGARAAKRLEGFAPQNR